MEKNVANTQSLLFQIAIRTLNMYVMEGFQGVKHLKYFSPSLSKQDQKMDLN